MPDHLLESSRRDDFNKRPNTGPSEEITQIVLNEVNHAPYLELCI